MTDNSGKRPTFEMSLDTRMALDRLRQAAVGDTVTFSDLSVALGREVDGGTPTVQAALRKLERDGVIFGNVRGVGYQRLSDSAIVNTAEHERAALRRKARRVVHRLTSVADFDALPNDLKVKHNAAVSGFGAIASVLSPAKMKSLETSVEKAQAKLPLAKTLAAFSDG